MFNSKKGNIFTKWWFYLIIIIIIIVASIVAGFLTVNLTFNPKPVVLGKAFLFH